MFAMKFGLQCDSNMGEQISKVNGWKLQYSQIKCGVVCSIKETYSLKYNRGNRTESYIIMEGAGEN